jgi:hypothetical protein
MLVEDSDGAAVTEACLYWCTPGSRADCEHPECCCECHARSLDDIDREVRAAELDDRPDDKLAAIARDLECERLPTLAELRAERFGAPRRRR